MQSRVDTRRLLLRQPLHLSLSLLLMVLRLLRQHTWLLFLPSGRTGSRSTRVSTSAEHYTNGANTSQ
jgi:hypothetical protein